MATIQPPIQSNASPTVRPWPRHRVMVKPTWGEAWQSAAYLETQQCTLSLAPSIPTATLLWRCGRIKYEDQTAFFNYDPINLLNYYVLIESLAESGDASATLFFGRIVSTQLSLGGASADGSGAGTYGDQVFVALGLEHLLDLVPIASAWITNDETSAKEISHPLVFNDRRDRRGYRTLGNRSAEVCSDGEHVAHVFSKNSAAWSAHDIIHHLLSFHVRGEVTFTLGGQLEALRAMVPTSFDPSGKTVYQCLNELIDRRRGLAWSVHTHNTTDDDGNVTATTAEIHVSTATDAPISVAGYTIPANAASQTLNLGTEIAIESCSVNQDTANRYGRIIVSGERVLSCFSVSLADNESLTAAWTDAEQTAYKNGAGGDDAQANDDARSVESLHHVFRQFLIPKGWSFKAGNGTGNGAKNTANPPVDGNGTLQVGVGQTANIRQFDQVLERQLPLRYTHATESNVTEYKAPFAVLKHPTSERWVYAHDHGDPGLARGYVRMLDSDFGLEVDFRPAHLLAAAGLDWSEARASSDQPQFDWRTMIVTVAMRTDQRLQVITDVEGEEGAEARVLHIALNNAEMWYVTPGTVTGVSTAGKLQHHAGGLVRDDSARARQVAAQAKAWYGRTRASLDLTVRAFWYGNAPGSYVSAVADAIMHEPINSLVSSKVYDFRRGTTQILCGFAEMDFSY